MRVIYALYGNYVKYLKIDMLFNWCSFMLFILFMMFMRKNTCAVDICLMKLIILIVIKLYMYVIAMLLSNFLLLE